ncbi:hypothetical protein BS47DRAFT_636209 [Hydnum rufescens UP504]|uniref:DUF1764-domain-containing protein n=1 Tax=Hydnum rufescens UP504 TaxID=1448309 RepID=A0A9P6E2L8_9AGAM|nr:hypothetical protein BS47DRAFT_636209 [Hydnum rufescens UP504]
MPTTLCLPLVPVHPHHQSCPYPSSMLGSPPLRNINVETYTMRTGAITWSSSRHTRAMPAVSEIDEIFASAPKKPRPEGRGKVPTARAPSTAITSLSKPKKKKPQKNPGGSASTTVIRSTESTDQYASTSATLVSSETVTEKRRVPETVLDPSRSLTSKRRKIDALLSGGGARQAGDNMGAPYSPPTNSAPVGVGKRKDAFTAESAPDDDIDRFRDSRGTGPRRRTEEGYAIYKEDELGIDIEAGETPLCPFDCNCCECNDRQSICPCENPLLPGF